jgi:hypothetical protein
VGFLDAGFEGCEVVVGQVLLRGVVVVTVSSGFEVIDGVVLVLLDFGWRFCIGESITYLAGGNNLLVIKILALQSRDKVADVILNMQNILTRSLLTTSPTRVAEVVHLRATTSARWSQQ